MHPQTPPPPGPPKPPTPTLKPSTPTPTASTPTAKPIPTLKPSTSPPKASTPTPKPPTPTLKPSTSPPKTSTSTPKSPTPPPPAPPKRIILPDSDEDLLDECDVETFRSSGKGGQHVNKTESAVRLRHLPSGLVVSCQEDRSQHMNKQTCLRKLRDKVEVLNHRPAPRKATKVPRGVKRALRKAKSHQSKKKQGRNRDWSNGEE